MNKHKQFLAVMQNAFSNKLDAVSLKFEQNLMQSCMERYPIYTFASIIAAFLGAFRARKFATECYQRWQSQVKLESKSMLNVSPGKLTN